MLISYRPGTKVYHRLHHQAQKQLQCRLQVIPLSTLYNSFAKSEIARQEEEGKSFALGGSEGGPNQK